MMLAQAQGSYTVGMAELAKSPPSVFSTCELMARKEMLEAYALFQIGRLSEAEASMGMAEHACPNADPILAADLATRRGIILDDAVTAEADYRTAARIAREQQDAFREAAALVNLGQASLYQEHYDESIDSSVASLKISREFGFKLLEEKAEGNLATGYYKLGNFTQAARLFQEAEESARALGSGPDQIRWRNSVGQLDEQNGQLAAAEAEYRQVLAMAQQHEDKFQATIASGELAFVSIRAGKWEQAAVFTPQALELAREERDHPLELQALLAQALIAARQGDAKVAEKLLTEVAADPGFDRQSAHWEAQAALAGLYSSENKPSAARAEYSAALNTVRVARCNVQHEELRMPFFANTARIYDSYIAFLLREGKIDEALKIADESRALTLAEGLGVEGKKCLAAEAGFDPRRAARQTGATILFYWLGAEHSYLWAVSPERVKLYPLPPAEQIESAADAYRKTLLGSRDAVESVDANGGWLYQTLLAPAAEFFRPGGRVVVIGDGSLNRLNFETLIAPQPRPHYWIEDVTIENASSLRLLLAATHQKHGPAVRRLLLMGDAMPTGDGQFGALPHAAEEIGSIRKYFAPANEQVYERGGSTAGAYMGSHPEQFAYIHFVAHGTASLTDPLDSAVVLSPSQPDGAYKLYARDVMTRPLKAELVTVSTCQGAGVRTYTGEGLVGLSWAFLHAGAHHVIGALWDVSDISTPRLMDAMYAGLVKGSTPDVALRMAKLSLLHSGAPFRKPYYWAAFQLYTGS